MKFLLLASAVPALVAALPQASTPETEIVWDTNTPVDAPTGYSQRDEEGPAIEDLPPDDSIVGGYTARAGEFPSTISLMRSGSHICGAALINANTALTAAHCVDGGGSFSVAAGTNAWRTGGTRSAVSRVIISSQYNRNTLDNDFAILKLSTRINAGGNIAYARLPAAGSEPAAETQTVVAGWGATRAGGAGSANLLAVQVPIIHPTTCARLVAPEAFTQNMICAGFTQGGRDSCQGDSGGPLYNAATREVVGVVSWGLNGCAAPNSPGVYARVGRAITFIQQNSA